MVLNKNKRKKSWDDIAFDTVCGLFLILFVILVFYPIYFVVIASFTKPEIVNSGSILLYPKEITFVGYKKTFEDVQIWIGYANTILYTVGGTLLGTIVTLLAGYALSRKDLVGRGFLMKIYVFTMYFSGGMIPLFLTVNTLGLVNSRLTMVIIGCVSAYNIIIVRSFMENTIPDELLDAATVDGCGNGNFFLKIVLPLSKAIIAVIVMYIAVAYWNNYFNAMLFLVDSNKFPLQMRLREILLLAAAAKGDTEMAVEDPAYLEQLMNMAQVVKYCVIVVATAPIICIYPFIQKYFVKGVMIGSVKG